MKRLLIANRGEIAVRIIRACREQGIVPIAVFSEADRHSLHVQLADYAYPIGAASPNLSYLNIPNLMRAAEAMNADAIHPGYGFLSERAEFAEACENAGITFVGPPSPVIRRLGDKIAAKQMMAKAGIPVVPGYNGEDQSNTVLMRHAQEIGFPLLIKASAGGGGRGMRIVTASEEFLEKVDEARREATSAFGDDRLLLERYIPRARHIEVQILADTSGNIVHLFERECSIQRRHQKIIEESPSTALNPVLRHRITQAAVETARASHYVNAGTVEFLLQEGDSNDSEFYFLEVNTRLQVEHPVTELVTGKDLVALQFWVAQGKPLPFTQDEVQQFGHSLQLRIYAEDPAHGFLPSIGTLTSYKEPTRPGVRVDSGVRQGDAISPYYDPMLAKLIVHAENRAEAIAKMEQALREYTILGVTTNIPYLLAILKNDVFQAGRLSTTFLQEQFANWRHEPKLPNEVLLALALEAVASKPTSKASTSPNASPISAWSAINGWRNT